MKPPMDHQPARRSFRDANGRPVPERLSEYFDFTRWPEKATRSVNRTELLALLTRWHMVQRDSRWYRRLWRWLRARAGSGPAIVPQPPSEQ